ncbi:MAG: glycosyltransferase, partial [Ruminococcus flavefaciens]|nr:glycosyltransferase [Ruminococcus flavefaciens]
MSVVTVSYNQGHYIKDNIESVLNQDYPNFEHIIIDACSTDNTLDILKSYPHLNWTSEPDRGQSDGLNKGFKKATGDIIFWINSDDMIAPGAFKAVNEFFENNPDKSVLVGNRVMIDDKGNTITVEHAFPFDLDYLLNSADVYVLQNATVFRKSVLERVG